MSQLLYPPSVNNLSKQLNSAYTNGDAVITLTNTTSVQNKPGVIIINRVDINGVRQAVAGWTYIEYTATSGATLTGCSVISGGQNQALGKVVEFVSDVTQQQRILDALANMVVIGTGVVDTTKIVDVSSSQTLTTKTLTSPVINTGFSGTAKAAGSDVTTGTSDTTIVTPKALKDSGVTALDGWLSDTATWTYVSASSFKISGTNVTTKFTKGTKIKLTDSTVKYFYVLSSAFSTDTTVTISGGSDYTLSDGALSLTYFSYADNPQGFPQVFNTGTITWDTSKIDNGTGGQQPTGSKSYFTIHGNVCEHWITLGSTNVVKNGTGPTIGFTIPATMPAVNTTAIDTAQLPIVGSCWFGSINYCGMVLLINSSSYIYFATYAYANTNITDNATIAATTGCYSYPI